MKFIGNIIKYQSSSFDITLKKSIDPNIFLVKIEETQLMNQ